MAKRRGMGCNMSEQNLIETWAQKLNGRQYRNETDRMEEDAARADNIVIVFGASDDLMELRGAINDEVGCYDGGTAYISPTGLLQNQCDEENCPYFQQACERAATINAVWDRDGYSWVYETDVPHATFDIMEDDEKYCRGIVFSLREVPA